MGKYRALYSDYVGYLYSYDGMVWLFSFYFPASSFCFTKIQLSVILCNILTMNFEINIFIIIEKDVKNVSERKLPI